MTNLSIKELKEMLGANYEFLKEEYEQSTKCCATCGKPVSFEEFCKVEAYQDGSFPCVECYAEYWNSFDVWQ